MTHRAFDEQMAALDALKGRELDTEAIAMVKKALSNRSNFLVAKAARLAEDNQLKQLEPDLIAAFDRFFSNPEKSDPQCWAKNALSRALSKLECRDKDVFLRGLRYQQWEPVWGGKSDSAGALRANCAHALIGCDGFDNQQLLILLLDSLVDHDKSVRVEAVRALAQLGDAAVPVLRLRALEPGPEPEEVMAQCFAALIAIEREVAIPFIAGFMKSENDASGEAAFALAETHHPAALAALLERQKTVSDPWFAGVLLSAIALTRLPQGLDFLIGLIEDEDRQAETAIEALARIAPAAELRERIQQVVDETGSQRLRKAWVEQFGVSTPPA
jgi:HEAT repeat protein